MAVQGTTNSQAFIEAQQYSTFILENLHDGLLPVDFYRDVTDFTHGTSLDIKTVGTVTLQEVTEYAPIVYNAIDSGTVRLSMTDYVGDGWAINDKLRMDGNQVERLHADRARESTRAFQEYVETRMFAVLDAAQDKTGDVNLINSRPHRWVAGGASATNRVMTLDDIIALKFSFDKANVPAGGRIMIVDPVVEAALNSLTNIVNVSNNPQFEGIITEGFAKDHQFVRNIYGFDIWTSNRLPVLTATEALDASSQGLANDTAEIGDIVNLAMCIADDQCVPGMVAWRQMPSVEGERNKDLAQDEFVTRAYMGLGAQRVDTLAAIITGPTDY